MTGPHAAPAATVLMSAVDRLLGRARDAGALVAHLRNAVHRAPLMTRDFDLEMFYNPGGIFKVDSYIGTNHHIFGSVGSP